jgi:hypothetical protein
MPQFAVSYRRQVHQTAVIAVTAETKEQATEKANAELTEQDWVTAFNFANVVEVKEVREV